MSLHHGDCLDVMAGMEPESVDAVVTDPPYGLEFMGKSWDRPWKGSGVGSVSAGFNGGGISATERLPSYVGDTNPRCLNCGKLRQGGKDKPWTCVCDKPSFRDTITPRMRAYGDWCNLWAEAAYRVAKPSAYLLAFGGTRTVHRMTVALEDAGWIIRDMLVWAYASGFPKSKASLKPAWEPIVMARKPGPLRELAIDACRIAGNVPKPGNVNPTAMSGANGVYGLDKRTTRQAEWEPTDGGRWPANVILTDPIFDGGWDGVVGGGEARSSGEYEAVVRGARTGPASIPLDNGPQYSDSGSYSRFFILPKADRTDREPVLQALAAGLSGSAAARPSAMPNNARPAPIGQSRTNHHPTVKPVELMRHLVRLVTPTGGIVLDPFGGSGSTALACELEGFPWILIEKELEYVRICEARLNGVQRGLGLPDARRDTGPVRCDVPRRSRAGSPARGGAPGGGDG